MATEDWWIWIGMALDSQHAAQYIESEHLRSCASRIYYSAYQAVTAVLLYRGCIPLSDREAWSHDVTPQLIIEQWEPLLASLDRRKDLANRLSTLYKLRISADYKGGEFVDALTVRKAMKNGNFLIKTATDILPGD